MMQPEKVFLEVDETTDTQELADRLMAALFGMPSPSPGEDPKPR